MTPAFLDRLFFLSSAALLKFAASPPVAVEFHSHLSQSVTLNQSLSFTPWHLSSRRCTFLTEHNGSETWEWQQRCAGITPYGKCLGIENDYLSSRSSVCCVLTEFVPATLVSVCDFFKNLPWEHLHSYHNNSSASMTVCERGSSAVSFEGVTFVHLEKI